MKPISWEARWGCVGLQGLRFARSSLTTQNRFQRSARERFCNYPTLENRRDCVSQIIVRTFQNCSPSSAVMYASSMILYLFIIGFIVCRWGTTHAKPVQSTGTQLLTLSNNSSKTNSYNPWSLLANDSSSSLNVSSPDSTEIRCERYKYGFIDDEVLVDCGQALPYMVGSHDINWVEDREMQGNVVCVPYRVYGSEYFLKTPLLDLRLQKASLAHTEHIGEGTCYFQIGIKEGKTSAHASMEQVRTAALLLSRQCGKRFQGGIATDVGQSPAFRNRPSSPPRFLGEGRSESFVSNLFR